jgi:hypothetical protein
MWKRILAALAVLFLAMLGYAATRPPTFRIERSLVVNAPPAAIAPLITDFHRWPEWSPYENRDRKMKRTYGGSPSGAHAVYEWSGNSAVGAGRMEISDVSPEKVTIVLDFSKPFQAHNTAEFLLQPKGDSTEVTWAMAGSNSFMAKLTSLFFNMDQLVGKDFETGLAKLKAVVEKQ